MKVLAGIGAALFGIALIVGIAVGGYKLHWWLAANNTNHQRQIDQQNYGSQLAYVTKLEATITDVANIDGQLANPNVPAAEKAPLQGQRAAIVQQGCSTAHLITNIPSADAAWVSSNC